MRSRLRTTAPALLVALSVLAATAACTGDDGADRTTSSAGPPSTSAPPTTSTSLAQGREVATGEGPVVGTVADGTRSFLGVPYASPPVGELRWAPPQPPAPRSGPLDASEHGPACVQETTSASAVVAEDCLTLNITTPDPPAPGLPVLVWIHGGSFVTGQGHDYDPRTLVADHDVVVVTVNYRLGALGFLAHPQLSAEAEDATSGNHGLDDQRAALAWVRDNVAAFGGDPTNLTVVGQSAGASSICFHLLDPQAEGLFQQAILQSGVCGYPDRATPTLAQGEASGAAIADALGCPPADAVACLREADTDALAAATEAAGLPAVVAATPVVDGTSVPDQPRVLLDAGDVLAVPVVVGSTRDEGTVFVYAAYDRTGTSLPAAAYPDALAATGGDHRRGELLAAYPLEGFPSPSQALAQARTDQLACSIDATATALARVTPTYRYEFADRTAPFSLPETPELAIGAGHGSELPYLFGSSAYPLTARSPAQLDDAQQHVADQLTAAWASFAADGDPGGDGAPTWPRAEPGDDDRLVFTSLGARVAGGFRDAHRCDVWAP